MRVRQKHVITVVMDATYDIGFGRLDARHGFSISRSTRISEIGEAGTGKERVLGSSEEHGFLWRLNTYWSYEERDGGLYVQIETISLSRAIPAGLGWALRPYVESVPRESMEFTLRCAQKRWRRVEVGLTQIKVGPCCRQKRNTGVLHCVQDDGFKKDDGFNDKEKRMNTKVAIGPMIFVPARRVNRSLTASMEKRVLCWMAERAPRWVTSDRLTVLGLSAQIGAGFFYALSRYNRYALLAVIVCLVLNWLGDSLDGTLARVRQQQRPRFGFYVDHVVDVFGSVALMCGLGCSGAAALADGDCDDGGVSTAVE